MRQKKNQRSPKLVVKPNAKLPKRVSLKLQEETRASKRWHTEAEAEAAAGGFTFADAEEERYGHEGGEAYAQQHFNYDDGEYDGSKWHEGEWCTISMEMRKKERKGTMRL